MGANEINLSLVVRAEDAPNLTRRLHAALFESASRPAVREAKL